LRQLSVTDTARTDFMRKKTGSLPGTHGNRVVRKVVADSVPFGTSISRNGSTCWAAFDVDKLIAVGATADEARSKFKALVRSKAVCLGA